MVIFWRQFLQAIAIGMLLSACAQSPSMGDVDPFSPNWMFEEKSLAGNQVRIEMSMKRYYSGGAGEARATFERRAKALMREGGYNGYEVIEYEEALDSSILGSKRTATGVIRLLRTAN